MYSPDKRPEARLVDKKQAAQNVALISYALFIFPPIGILTSIIGIYLAKKTKNERARSTAIGALIFNIAVLLILIFIIIFIREASVAVEP